MNLKEKNTTGAIQVGFLFTIAIILLFLMLFTNINDKTTNSVPYEQENADELNIQEDSTKLIEVENK